MVASESVAAGVAWLEACWVELEFGMFADGEHVVEVEAVIGGVFRGRIVYRHSAEPADCVPCLALSEECCFVFLELACGLACASCHCAVHLSACCVLSTCKTIDIMLL